MQNRYFWQKKRNTIFLHHMVALLSDSCLFSPFSYVKKTGLENGGAKRKLCFFKINEAALLAAKIIFPEEKTKVCT